MTTDYIAKEGGTVYTTKDSGKRVEFDSGMKRDTQDGKPRYDWACENGSVWVDSKQLMRSTFQLIWL